MSGLVLVFDLDNTLVNSKHFDERLKAKILPSSEEVAQQLNEHLISILIQAEYIRTTYKGSIDAILLLSNNTSGEYVSLVCSVIAERIASEIIKIKPEWSSYKRENFIQIRNRENARIIGTSPLFFDYIMIRRNTHRNRSNKGSVSKGFIEVRSMLNALQIEDKKLEKRVFFFDDENHAKMKKDLEGEPSRYIRIKNFTDASIYEPINNEFKRIKNGESLGQKTRGPGAYYSTTSECAGGACAFEGVLNNTAAGSAAGYAAAFAAQGKRDPAGGINETPLLPVVNESQASNPADSQVSLDGGKLKKKSKSRKRKYKSRRTRKRL